MEREKELIKQLDKEIVNLTKENINSEKSLFRGLVVAYEYSERDLGVPDNTTFRGEEAYKFIKKLMEEDIKQNKVQKMKEEGIDVQGSFYDKTYLSISYKGYDTKKIRVDLGDLEFGGKEKVSDGLEHRLKLFPNELLENKDQWAKMQRVKPEEIEIEAKNMLNHIDKIMTTFRGHEKKLEEREKAKTRTTEKIKPGKEKSKRQTRSRVKSKENER